MFRFIRFIRVWCERTFRTNQNVTDLCIDAISILCKGMIDEDCEL